MLANTPLRAGLVAATLAIATAIGAAPQASAEPVEVIMNDFTPPNFRSGRLGLRPWAEALEEASGGTMRVTIPTSSMAPFPRLWDIVQDRVVDMGVVPFAINDERINLTNLLYIPMIGADSSAVTSRALWETYQQFFAGAGQYEAQDLIPLSMWVIGGNQFFSRSKPLLGIEDFAGVKLRGEGRVPLQMFSDLGASPVGAPGIAAFELLSNGVVDVTMNPFGPAMSLGLPGQAAQVTTLPGGLFRPGFALVINRDAFEELPEEAQRALVETSGSILAERIGSLYDLDDADGRKVFEDEGATITPASDELRAGIVERTGWVEQDWLDKASAEGIDAAAALAFFRQQVQAGN